ncbi:hypothetical protein ACFL14_02985 [Patescibacteria group bacterium]
MVPKKTRLSRKKIKKSKSKKIQNQAKPKKAKQELIAIVQKKRIVGFMIFISVILILWGFGYSFRRVEPITIYEDSLTTVRLEVQNFPILEKASYELWQINRNQKISLGKFNINEQGQIIDLYNLVIENNEFNLILVENSVDAIQGFQISIEPNPDDNLDPSSTILVSGKINQQKQIDLRYIVELEGTKGSFALSSPTDGSEHTNESSGVWFVYKVKNNEIPSLDLPVLPEGWIYESWIFYENNYVSMGKFTDPAVSDAEARFSGKENILTFPGEDFLYKGDSDYATTFPFVLNNGSTQVLISIEPDIDGSDPTGLNPFSIQFLNAKIKKDAEVHKSYDLNLDLNIIPEGNIKIY